MNNILKENLQSDIQNLDIRILHFHERVNKARLIKLTHEIIHDGVLKKPVVVDRATLMVIDGHHRCHVFLRLGILTIPCYLVDYFDNNITVTFRRADIKNKLLKEIILQKVATGSLFPHKTTRHRLANRPIVNQKLVLPLKRDAYSTMKGVL